MAYFGGSQNLRGDPGFFGTLFGLGKRALRGAVGFATGGPGGALRGITQSTARAKFQRPTQFQGRSIAGRPQIGVIPATQQFFLGKPKTVVVDAETGEMMPKRRRMNVGNATALRRAIRRQKGFVRLAKSALKGTGMKIVSTSSGKVSRATMDKAVADAHHRR